MEKSLLEGSIGMPRGSLLRIDDGAGVLVRNWEGKLWLTQEGRPEDHLLHAGEWFRIDRDGVTLAHALRYSVVSFSPPASESPARRITFLRAETGTPLVLHRRSWLQRWHELRSFLARGGGSAGATRRPA